MWFPLCQHNIYVKTFMFRALFALYYICFTPTDKVVNLFCFQNSYQAIDFLQNAKMFDNMKRLFFILVPLHDHYMCISSAVGIEYNYCHRAGHEFRTNEDNATHGCWCSLRRQAISSYCNNNVCKVGSCWPLGRISTKLGHFRVVECWNIFRFLCDSSMFRVNCCCCRC